MCLAILAIDARPDLPLLIVANRDEYHARPATPAGPWQDHPDIYAGRDLAAGGTWLGITRRGCYALLTNYRDPSRIMAHAPSRGALVQDYLTGSASPLAYAQAVAQRGDAYNGFNLLAGDPSGCAYFGNRADEPARLLRPGIYGLSNQLLDTPWPKLVRLRQGVRDALAGPLPKVETLLGLLADRRPAPDRELPDTGVGLAHERMLSPPFIASEQYGTRCSTVIAVRANGQVLLHERSFGPGGTPLGDMRWTFELAR